MEKVYVVRCPDYAQAEIKIAELLDMMGGIEQFAAPGEQIVLKVNLLLDVEPERAVTTHPAVVAAVGKLTKQAGARPVIADSPGSGYAYNERTLQRIYHKCGMNDAAQQAGIELNMDTSYQTISFPQGELTKRLEIITPILQADGVFNLCKFKTHVFMSMTGAIKNNFGVIPGLTKPGYHAKLKDQQHFASMLLDLATYVSPRISIMDAVVGMEGEGPNAGQPRQVGLLLASRNQLALDVVAGAIMGLPRKYNPILVEAEKRGMTPHRLEQVDIIGVTIDDLRIPDFKLPVTVAGEANLGRTLSWWQKWTMPFWKDSLTLRPQVIESKCIACGACRDACPMNVIDIIGNGKKHAHIDKQNCIRCYCCHEMCPQDAIKLQPSLLYRIVNIFKL